MLRPPTSALPLVNTTLAFGKRSRAFNTSPSARPAVASPRALACALMLPFTRPRAAQRLRVLLTALGAAGLLALGLGSAACGDSGSMSKAEFVDVIGDADLETTLDSDVMKRYAECLYDASDGEVAEFVDNLGDAEYKPSKDAEAALAECSDKLAG